MSYDVTFIGKGEGQAWQEAGQPSAGLAVRDKPELQVAWAMPDLQRGGRVMDKEPWGAPAPEDARAEWRRIAARLLEVHGDLEQTEAPHVLELTDLETGLQVAFYEDEAGISAPYWHAGEETEAIVAIMRRLATIIERETGLVGYDPQLDARFVDVEDAPGEAGAIMTSVSERIKRGDLFEKEEAKGKERRWWEFWKR